MVLLLHMSIARGFSVLVSILVLIFGIGCTAFPQFILEFYFHQPCESKGSKDNDGSSGLETGLLVFIGGLLICNSLSTLLLEYCTCGGSSSSFVGNAGIYHDSNRTSRVILLLQEQQQEQQKKHQIRMALIMHTMMGFMVVLVGLFNKSWEQCDNNTNDKNNNTGVADKNAMFAFLACGSIILILSSIGLMASFWPVAATNNNNSELIVVGVMEENRCGENTSSSQLVVTSDSPATDPSTAETTNVSAASNNTRSKNKNKLQSASAASASSPVPPPPSAFRGFRNLLSNKRTTTGNDDDYISDDGMHPLSSENVELGFTTPLLRKTSHDENYNNDDDSNEDLYQPPHDNNVDSLLQPDHTKNDANPLHDNPPDETPQQQQQQHHHQQQQQEEEEETYTRITGIKRLLQLASPQKPCLYIGCIVLFIRLPFSLSIPHFVSATFGALSQQNYDTARYEILMLFLLGTIDAVLDFWCVYLFGLSNERIVRSLRIDTFRSLMRQDVSFFDGTNSGELTSRLTADCGEMASELTWVFRFSIEAMVRITGIAGYMLIRSPLLGASALCVIPFVACANKKYGHFLQQNAKQVQTALAEANTVAQETFSCIRTVIAFASEELEMTKYGNKIQNQYLLNVRQLFAQGVYFMTISTFLINTCVQAYLLLIGTMLIQQGKLTSEVLLAFMLYQGQLQEYTLQLFQSYTSLLKSSGAGDKVFAILDRIPPPPGTGNTSCLPSPSSPTDPTNPLFSNIMPSVNKTHPLQSQSQQQNTIQLSQVTFTYPSRPTHTVLQNLSLSIPGGCTMALVGPSGCGKTTIISLIQRFYDPNHGQIQIDNVDLTHMDIKRHRRNVGIVTQEPVLFSGSIYSNIVYGSSHHPGNNDDDDDDDDDNNGNDTAMANAMQAAKLANAHSFITSFPNGYNTQVGERGLQLSGGQKQRIAIARAIFKRPSILLLDEATSALDSESERLVQDALDKLMLKSDANKSMTTIVVAHRLQTVRNADCIAVIHDGRVVEQGSHNELMGMGEGGKYKKMVMLADSLGHLPESY
eukprot:CAMPEP_0195510720 /NCGR_PEP_ID=MMETSP0794_2-20130614/3278_1 /TAXON_ID=515487 /ORGANISM="Stephanopyxis turris, Strain CCMP 815" /LENGTH=1038 /DNA_ID=CAMNT_0040638197 /DNA_START=13 /DNA_END=3129 /DNA_ORIENTATION=-